MSDLRFLVVDIRSQKKRGKTGEKAAKIRGNSGLTPLWRAAGSGAIAPPLAARSRQTVLEKIPGQLEALFLIFFTLGSIKQSNTHISIRKIQVKE